ncbi:hypothetical protein LIER_09375 [Lithospermum erythrorhizon]|uniref:Aminotransferase-like plant mobile domain-containing protein n=1 Tax=Lithospermum erythrorhizon TaxID=34254 RepID=A0AAV3PFJ9_LITER
MVGPEEDKVATLVVHTPLYKGHAAPWPSIPAPELERGCSWSSVQEKVIYLEGPDQNSPNFPHGFCFLSTMISIRQYSGGILALGLPLLGFHYPDGTVSVSAWIGFWNHSLRTDVSHEAADWSTTKIPPASICPRELTTPQHRSWDSSDRYPFDVLEVDANLEEEVYCAAFLSCWLCVFVLPVEPLGFIRASMFKMSSIMAKGSRVSLAPPVLACIYRSLSQISLFDNPSTAQECFLLKL